MKRNCLHICSTTFLLVLVFSLSCSTDKKAGKDEPKKSTEPETAKTDRECRADIWQRVYNPSRLEVIEQCKQVTGTIEELDQNEDGDTHMLLKLDPGQGDLLTKKNNTKKDGNLVLEIVCSAPVRDKKVGDICTGYENHVTIPKVGDHVTVLGSYVNDTHNSWTEIHPVSKIEPK